MSVFSCRELADDWQIAPRTPVLTAVNGQTSLNYDNYSDTEHGAVQAGNTLYPNVPDDYVNVLNVPAASTWLEFKAIYDTAQAGDVVVLLDGAYSWTGSLWLQNSNGTIDDPIVIMSETPGGAVFSNNSEKILCFEAYHILCGITVTDADTTFSSPRNIFVRYTSFRFNGGSAQKLAVESAAATNRQNFEFDNIVFDGLDQADIGSGVGFNTPDGRQPANVRNPQILRLHHNSYINAPTVVLGSESWIVGLAFKVDDTAVTNYNVFENNTKFIVENNLLDGWAGDEQVGLIKSGTGIIRNNLDVNAVTNGEVLRMSNNILYHGNWHEQMRSYYRLSADWVLALFNYHSINTPGSECIALHPGTVGTADAGVVLDGIWQYKDPSNSIIVQNVFNRYSVQMRGFDRWTQDTVFKQNPSNCLLENNSFYSSDMPQTDAPDSGGYVNDDGLFTEAQFRNTNTWGENNYVNTPLAVTNFISPTLFDGPGSTYIVPDPTKYYGQPSQIPMPSWWKLP